MPSNSQMFPALARLIPVLLAALLVACSQGGSERAATKLTFKPKIEIISASGQESPAATGEADRIVSMLTGWYQQAFLDPAGWDNPDRVLESFTGEARSRIRKELASVTIGEGYKDVVSVRPLSTNMDVTLYLDTGGSPTYAIARVLFDASGTVKKKGGLPLRIVQRGTYYLRQVSSDWKIFAYTARADQAQNPEPPR